MGKLFDFDKNYNKHLRVFYYFMSVVLIYKNLYDLIFDFHSWSYPLHWYNITVILIIICGVVVFTRKLITTKTALILGMYSILSYVIVGNIISIYNQKEIEVYLLRDALYVSFLIIGLYLFINETHGLITGILFVIYFIIITIRSQNPFLLSHLHVFIVHFVSYILAINYFYRYLRHIIQKVNNNSQLIKNQNNELQVINKELTETHIHINAQHEELITLSESISNQNNILEEQNAKLEESVQLKSKLFSIIAHDIKSPLFSMSSLIELMLNKYEEFEDDRKKIFLTKMLSTSKVLQDLIENLLTWSRTQTGMLEIKPETIKLNETIDKIIEIYKNYASNKSVRIIHEIEDNLRVITDRMMLETVLRNIISNAIKYSFENGIVNVYVKKQHPGIQFSIQDHGVGINQERVNTLFSVSNSTITFGTKGEKGTGLGLRICKEFLEKLKGKLEIKSEENTGTTINIIIPDGVV
jgi:signal transduction histidine kinase